MFKRILCLLIISFFFLRNTPIVFAEIGAGDSCGASNSTSPQEPCVKDHCCESEPARPDVFTCKYNPVCAKFGRIPVPGALGGLIGNNPTGAGAISQFLTNFIALLFSIAAIVLVFMFIWAAFEWLTSGGDKEKIAAAQKRIIHAVIGILLFAVAFVIIRVVGIFTGFTFFEGQNYRITNKKDASGRIIVACSNGKEFTVAPSQPYPSPSELNYQCQLK